MMYSIRRICLNPLRHDWLHVLAGSRKRICYSHTEGAMNTILSPVCIHLHLLPLKKGKVASKHAAWSMDRTWRRTKQKRRLLLAIDGQEAITLCSFYCPEILAMGTKVLVQAATPWNPPPPPPSGDDGSCGYAHFRHPLQQSAPHGTTARCCHDASAVANLLANNQNA